MTIPPHPLAFLFPGFSITDIQVQETNLVLTATAITRSRNCPRCGCLSTSVHSNYTRNPRDLPLVGYTLRLVLHVRRFGCLNPNCSTVTFTERLSGLLLASAQRTLRLTTALHELGLALGGEAGCRQSKPAGMPASAATILRLVHRTPPVLPPPPRVLGIDDFALCRGRVYGTILVDNDTHRPVDLLPDRSAETVAAWLKQHRGIEIITRDRSTEYARGVAEGASQATQVADRWHLLANLREALERMLDRLRPQLLDGSMMPAGGTPATQQRSTTGSPLTRRNRKAERGRPWRNTSWNSLQRATYAFISRQASTTQSGFLRGNRSRASYSF